MSVGCEPVPEGSLYFWCYRQGLRGVDQRDLVDAVIKSGRSLRPKDLQNHANGWYRSDLYMRPREDSVWHVRTAGVPRTPGYLTAYGEYPPSPYDLGEINNRWVPCNKDNKPMIKWGKGCMTMADAKGMLGQVFLAENNRGMGQVIIDVDGDHDGLDEELIGFMYRFFDRTRADYKLEYHEAYSPAEGKVVRIPVSYHLTFLTDRVIPTMHFPSAHVDIVGNKENSLRYFKTKRWNGLQPMWMNDAIWAEIMEFVKRRETNG